MSYTAIIGHDLKADDVGNGVPYPFGSIARLMAVEDARSARYVHGGYYDTIQQYIDSIGARV